MTVDGASAEELLQRVRGGDVAALAEYYERQRPRLARMVAFRLDPRLRGRVDADDVLQEGYVDAAQRLEHFNGVSEASLFVWLRLIVQQAMINAHRKHVGAQARDAGRDVLLGSLRAPGSTSASLVISLVGQFTSPTQAARREELSQQLARALESMSEIDREVLALRHFEELSNSEVAAALEIEPKAASIRYVRALRRLREVLREIPEFGDSLTRIGGDGVPPGDAD